MMKIRHFLILMFLMIAMLCPGFASRAAAQEQGAACPDFLELDVQADEASGQVDCVWMLENPSDTPWAGELALPVLSTGYREESLEVSASAACFYTGGGRLRCRIEAGEVLTVRYRYQSTASLVHARIIALDLTAEPFSRFPQIGHLRFAFTLREEEMPLVREISPINWTFEDNVISVELFRFTPSRLLPRIYVEKETFRDLKSERAATPNEVQRIVLSRYPEWFEDGLPPWGRDENIYDLFARMLEDDLGRRSLHYEPWELYEKLLENDLIYNHMFCYLLLREVESGRFTKEQEERAGWTIRGGLSLLGVELMRQRLYGDEMYRLVVDFVQEEALRNVPLYYWFSEELFGPPSLKASDQDRLLAVKPRGGGGGAAYELFRIMVLPASSSFSAEELADLLTAVGADLYLQQRILDAREEPYPKHQTGDENYPEYEYVSYFAVTPDAILTEEVFRNTIGRMMNDEWLQDYYMPCLLTRPDPLLSSLPVPCAVQYTGAVTMQYTDEAPDGPGRYPFFHNFDEFSYQSPRLGKALLKELVKEPSVAARKKARQEEERQQLAPLLDRIRAQSTTVDRFYPALSFTPSAGPPARLRIRWQRWAAQEAAVSERDPAAAPCAAYNKLGIYEEITGGK
ncbi:MAG: hypothetical protein IJK86_05410 [Lachnospiraceae bacterium]|nr:hypothetical protein [Lachnospiraceae bacterium]